jgi:hypothetical protein
VPRLPRECSPPGVNSGRLISTNSFFQLLCLDKVSVGAYPAYKLRFLRNRADPGAAPVREEIDRVFFLANGRSYNADGFIVPNDPVVARIETVTASIVLGP